MEVVPFESVGELRFGDTQAAVRQRLSSAFTTFRKGKSRSETDAFHDLGLHVYYDDSGVVEFIEAFDPADITIQGVHFLGRDVNDVVSDMKRRGYESQEGDGDPDFTSAGIALTVSEEMVEGVAVYKTGYYD